MSFSSISKLMHNNDVFLYRCTTIPQQFCLSISKRTNYKSEFDNGVVITHATERLSIECCNVKTK